MTELEAHPGSSERGATLGESGSTPEPLYRAEVTVRAHGGPDKQVRFAVDDVEATMGMSGTLGSFYGSEPGTYTEHASTLDYVVGATAACLLGTFRRALGARGITVTGEQLTAEAVGDVIVDGDVPILKRIVVSYTLSAPEGADLETIERAHSVHHRACAVSRSLESSIDIRTELELV
jgi:uncharacterized OsmC-like protein